MTLREKLQKTFGTALAALALGVTATTAIAHQEGETPSRPSAASVLANLETGSPFHLAYVVSEEWAAGNKLKAAFWYYIWQIRTDAWVTGVDEPGFKAFRSMMSDQMGQGVNVWITADPALMRETAERAISYEARLPLSIQRPDDMSEADWLDIVAKSRADYARELQEAFADISDDEIIKTRQKNGLPVGTPMDQGQPLPDDWR